MTDTSSSSPRADAPRNLAIIAHVDHGKTTMVDQMFWQSGTFRANQQVAERALDSNDQERERGITILAKCTSVLWNGERINIVDTPGHADFGGEVERILSMVDGVLLLVDAAEGPMPQTKFVTMKALAKGLKPIVVVNKADKPDARAWEVQAEVFDLFANLDADDDQLDFPTVFASAKEGWADLEPEGARKDLAPLFNAIVDRVPQAPGDPEAPFAMLATTIEADPYLGRILTGRVYSGTARMNMPIKGLKRDGSGAVESARLTKLFAYRGLSREPVEEAKAGDIVAVAGLQETTVADTICAAEVEAPIPADPIDPPTLAMTFTVNDSPMAGKEGDKVTSRLIKARLDREAEGNVALSVRETDQKDAYEVAGRGELQLGVLIETLRREGFELSISRPRVLFQQDPETGATLEPYEYVQVDVDEDYSGVVVEKLNQRKGEMLDMQPSGGGKQRLAFRIPARGLIGYQGEFLTDTRGTGMMNTAFDSYGPYAGPIHTRRNGVIISQDQGQAAAYAIWNLEDRGVFFIDPGDTVYQGMILGEHNRPMELEVNPMKAKQLSNVRSSGKDEAIKLTPPRRMTLEQALSYIADDELVEVTPKSLRMRKKTLDPHQRKREQKTKAAAG
jgi:GTP-binding protein